MVQAPRLVFINFCALITFILVTAIVGMIVFFVCMIANGSLPSYLNGNYPSILSVFNMLWASAIADITGIFTALALTERIFPDYSKRFIASIIFIYFSFMALISFLPSILAISIILNEVINSENWRDTLSKIASNKETYDLIFGVYDLSELRFLINGGVSCVLAWIYLWHGKSL